MAQPVWEPACWLLTDQTLLTQVQQLCALVSTRVNGSLASTPAPTEGCWQQHGSKRDALQQVMDELGPTQTAECWSGLKRIEPLGHEDLEEP